MEKYQQTATSLFGSLKNAVLGNPVTREYQVGKQVATFGPGLCWKVFEGKKKTTGQEVSVLLLEKKALDNYDKKEKEIILEMFRKGPQQLAKLRHPRLLTVQQTIEESRDSLAFATEPIFASLTNILAKHETLKTYELYDVEKVYGLLQIAEGLAFLHNDVKLIEGNVTPNNIVVTKDGQWKLAGFNFALPSSQGAHQAFNWESRLPIIAKPELNYLAPEYILCQTCECPSDMYSFGCLMNAVYNDMKTPFDAGNSIESYKRCIEQFCRLGSDSMRDVPIVVRDHVKSLLNIAPGVRPDANQTTKHEFFDDVAAMTLKYLHTLVQRDEMTKSQFYKSLHRVLSKLPKRVIHQRVLPHLFLEFPNHAMIPFVLPNIMLIIEDCSDQEYIELILPELKKIFPVQEPVQVLLIFMQKMELLLKKTPADDVRNYVLPMVFRALESTSSQIEELVLSIIPDFAHMIDYSSLKNSIIPRVKALVLRTTVLSVRVNALVCIGKIIEFLDKFMMMDDIFPILPQIPSKEPAVLMAILGIYKKTLAHKKMNIEKDYLATKVIPFLLPIAVDPGLNVSQFNNFMSVIRDMLDRVDQEHRTKLEQLSKMQEQQKSALEFSKAIDESRDMKEMLDKVDRMVLGSPEKASDNSTASEFSRVFGILTDDSPSGRKQTKDLMARDENQSSTPFTSSSSQGSAASAMPSYPTNQASNNRNDFKPAPFSSSTNRPVTSNSSSYQVTSAKTNRPQHEPYQSQPADSQRKMQTDSRYSHQSTSRAGSGVLQSQKSQPSSVNQSNRSNTSSLDSLMMKNVGLTSTVASSSMSNQSLAGIGSGQITSQPYQGMVRDSYNAGHSTMGLNNLGQSTMMGQGMANRNMTGQNTMRGQSMAGQSAMIGQHTMGQGSISDPALDPFSMNQGMAMGAMKMQNKPAQQQQGVQPSMMNFGNSQMPNGLIQSQTQSITMFQTQTQHLMGGPQQTTPHAQSQQQPTNLYQQQNPSGMLIPQQMNASMASNNGSSNTGTFKTADLHDLLI